MRAVTAHRFVRGLFALLAVFLAVAILYIAVPAALRARANFKCEQTLRQLHTALKNYAQNTSNRDWYPPLSPVPGRLVFVPPLDSKNPASKNASAQINNDTEYWYLGWMITNERSGLEWIEQYRAHAPNVDAIPAQNGVWPEFEDDLAARQRKLETNWLKTHPDGKPQPNVKDFWPIAHPFWEERRFYCPARQGMERFLITEIGNPNSSSQLQSRLPIVIERPERHGDGGHVLYMDDHVEFVPYPGKFPMTPAFIEGLRSLDALETEAEPRDAN